MAKNFLDLVKDINSEIHSTNLANPKQDTNFKAA